MTETDSAPDHEPGRARVRRVLIEPLEEAGMVRPQTMKAEDYQAFRGRLQDKLAYLSEEALAGLRALVTHGARGKHKDQWPKEVTITSIAYRLHPPPPRACDYAVSVLRSAMGRTARSMGYQVELLDIARRWGPPPGRYQLDQLQAQSQDNRAKVRIIEGRIGRGVATSDEVGWLGWYRALSDECDAIQQAEGQAA